MTIEPHAAPKSRGLKLWKIVAAAAVAVAVSTGVYVGWVFRSLAVDASAIQKLTSEELASLHAATRIEQLGSNNPPTDEYISPVLNEAIMRHPIDASLENEVDAMERLRCEQDPHLAMALERPFSTPLASPNPALLRQQLIENESKILEAWITDYQARTRDSADLQATLLPLFRAMSPLTEGRPEEQADTLVTLVDSDSDPLTLLLASTSTNNRDENLKRAIQAVSTRSTHPALRMKICLRALGVKRQFNSKQRGEIVDMAIVSTSELLRDETIDEFWFDFCLTFVTNIYLQMDDAGLAALTQELTRTPEEGSQEAEIPESITYGAVACLSYRMAEIYRGSTYIHEVSESNLALFRNYADISAQYFQKAWVKAPSRQSQAYFARSLLMVELVSGATLRSHDEWFRHSLSSELDSPRAVELYTNSCLPRWGGSIEKLAWLTGQLGDCATLESDFYCSLCTPARHYYYETGRETPLVAADLLRAAKTTLAHVRELAPNDSARPRGGSAAIIAKILWDAGELEELSWYLQNDKSSIDRNSLAEFNLDLALVQSVCRSVNERTRKAWKIVHRDLFQRCHTLSGEDVAKIHDILERAKEFSDPEELDGISKCQWICKQLKRFHSGETVSLKFDEIQPDWLVAGKAEIIDEDTIEFSVMPRDNPRFLTALARFPLPVRVDATISQTQEGADPFGVAIQMCWRGQVTDILSGMQLRCLPRYDAGTWDYIEPGYNTDERQMSYMMDADRSEHSLVLTMTDSMASATIDGRLCEDIYRPFNNNGLIILGREASYTYSELYDKPEVKYQISNVRVTKIP